MKIFAHRGFSFEYPEASRAAYEAAIEVGADGLECDIRLTKDGIPICFHDRDTKRFLGVKRVISKTTYSELKKALDLMTLDDLLKLADGAEKSLLIETKHPVRYGSKVEKEVLSRVNKSGRKSRAILISFSILATLRLQRRYHDVGFVISRAWRALWIPTKIVAIDIELYRRSKWVRKRTMNKERLIWTVNNPTEIPLLKEWGVSGVITDRPDLDFRS